MIPVRRLACVPLLLCFGAQSLPAQSVPPDVRLLADAYNQFAVDLHGKLAANGAAANASPASIALALSMLLLGARGETERELLTALHLPEELRGARLHAAVDGLDESLGVARKGRHDQDGPRLRIANDLWTQTGYPLVPEYGRLLDQYYHAGLHSLSFRGDPAGARKRINEHIATQTNQRIRDLLSEQTITAATRVVLTNALWLQAPWAHEFPVKDTRPQPFTDSAGQRADVPTMHVTESFDYAETADWQWVALPFQGGQLVCELMLPQPGKPAASAMPGLLAGAGASAANPQLVHVQMPQFRVRGAYRLREALVALGLASAFDAGKADFGGISTQHDLVVDDVVHQTWVQAAETGVEAAAATAVVLKDLGAKVPANAKHFVADRPFAFVLRHRPSGLVLFVGRVDDARPTPVAPAAHR